MSMHRNALLIAAGLAALAIGASSSAVAQKYYERGARTYQQAPPATHVQRDRRGRDYGGFNEGIGIGIAIGTALPGIIDSLPRDEPPPGGGRFIDDDNVVEPIDRRRVRRPVRRQQPRRVVVPMPPPRVAQRPSGAPPAGETRLIPDEVVIELSNAVTAQQITALQQRFQLERLESLPFALSGTTLYRWRIPDARSVPDVIRSLEQDQLVASAQPNYLYTLQEPETPQASESEAAEDNGGAQSAQYALAKLSLPQAHRLAKGNNVRVAVIDSAVDLQSPEFAGSIAGSFDTLKSPRKPHAHGTSIAGVIAAHGQLTGAAPGAKLLVVRAFDPDGDSAQGSTFNVLKGLDWAVQNRARVINMSFAGPSDPALHRSLQAAHKKGIVLVAAAGNAGAKSPPLYPAAYQQVIAVSATDAEDQLLEQSNRGQQIALAAPGKDILVALPDGGVEMSSGTSLSAAKVSGVAALLIESDGKLTPDKLRGLLERTAKDIGPKGRDELFGYGLVNAFAALTAATAPVMATVPLPIARVSTGAR